MRQPARYAARADAARLERHWRSRLAGLAMLLVALSFVLAACGASTRPAAVVWPTPAVSSAPTPTLAPAHALDWQVGQLPFQPSGSEGWSYNVAFTQSEGNAAYVCGVPGRQATTARLWVTHDRAAHWTTIPAPTIAGVIASCALIADDLQPAILIVRLCAPNTQLGSFCPASLSLLTLDGGASWRPVSGVTPYFMQLATRGAVTLALASTPPHSACISCTTALALSADGLRSWTRIDDQITAAGRFVLRFWVEPASGVILAETSSHYAQHNELWLSADGGQHWTQTPNSTLDGYAVQPPQPGQPWRACGYHTSFSSAQPTYPSFLECTGDSGQTWTEAGGPYPGPTAGVFPIAMAADGSVLAIGPVAGARSQSELRRLAPGASAWESLGPAPSFGSIVYLAGGIGPATVWFTPALGPTNSSPQTLYSAPYP